MTHTAETWREQQRSRYSGPEAATVSDLTPYTGIEAVNRIVGKDRRDAYLLNYRQIEINYGDGVEFQLRRRLVILCPRTARVLYDGFTPLETRYAKGSRPVLEQAVAAATAECRTDEARALALMRYCRDLRLKAPEADFSKYVYGGTEEQLIQKPDILCETLSRLMVALCQVAGLPARLVMHIGGGHIATEVHINGHWAYIDPRCGVFFRKPDGNLASVLELWRDPGIIRSQPESVKREVNPEWTWAFRAWKCENMFFNPDEINGFENYSLAESAQLDFRQIARARALENGLMTVNREYVAAARRALGLVPEGWRYQWARRPLRKLDLAYRNDGFSIFFKKPPMDVAELRRRYIDPFRNSNASTLVWGVGPGSVFCFETNVGEIFGEGLTPRQRSLLREGDLWVHENVMNLIRAGTGPMAAAVDAAHAIGRKLIARLEMNHEYGPARDDNWKWVAFVGSLNKKHPEYRIPGTVLLDYRHAEVRAFKLKVLRETVQLGADGVSLDFAVYPPFFEKPAPAIMTSFVREVRTMLDEEGGKRGHRLELMVRVPTPGARDLGLDWEAWMREGLIDVIFPTHRRFPDLFDLRVERFIDVGVETGVRVYPTIWQALGFVDTDQRPGDKAKGRRRYDKPKTPGMYRAQALLFMRAGADGIQLGMSEDQWRGKPWMNDLVDPEKLLFANKHYMVDPVSIRPGTIKLAKNENGFRGTMTLGLRLGDDIAAAGKAGYAVAATTVVHCRPLETGERLSLFVNGRGPVEISGDSIEESKRRGKGAAIDPAGGKHETFIYRRNWWKRGEHKLATPADWWNIGDNRIVLAYSTKSRSTVPRFKITWVDLLLEYTKPQPAERRRD